MNIEKLFVFLIRDYGLAYKYQKFINCYGGNWIVQTYSFYNDSGCFTIYFLPPKTSWIFTTHPSLALNVKIYAKKWLIFAP